MTQTQLRSRLSSALALAAATVSTPVIISRCSGSSDEVTVTSSRLIKSKVPSLADDAAFVSSLRSLVSPITPLLNPRAPFSSTLVPLIPEALAGEEAVESRDPLAFTENCLLRALGAVVVGGVLGFGIGALFSGYGALAPYDPALRDWQLVQEHQKQLAAAKAAQQSATGTGTAASSTAAPLSHSSHSPLQSSSSSLSATAQRNTVAEVLAPVHMPPLPSLNGPGALPMSFPEPPTMTLRQAFVTGLREMVVRGWASGKSFGIVGGIYTVVDCNLEKIRGVKDFKSAVAAGFITGAAIAAPAGVSAAIIGGAGFAMFSAIIEVVSPILFDH